MMGIKLKTERNVTLLRIFLYVILLCILIYVLLSIFAPGHLQRFVSKMHSRFQSGDGSTIRIATASTGGHYYRLGNLMKAELSKSNDLDLKVLVTDGTLENLELLQNRKADFALIQGGFPESAAVNFKGLRAVTNIAYQYVHILTLKNSSIKEFKDLSGKRVSLGPEKSGNAILGRLVFDYYRPSAGVRLVYNKVSDMEEYLDTNEIDTFFSVYDLHAPILEKLLATGKYRLVPIPESFSIAHAIPGCFAAVLPHSLYGSNRNIPAREEGEFSTLKVNTLLVTREDMNAYVINSLLQVVYSTSFIKKSKLPELREEWGRNVFDLPLHPAAERFYRRNDPVTADKFEIGSALIASLLFIVSIFGYFINRYKARLNKKQKKNIIPYFEEMLEYGKRLSAAQDIEQLKELLDSMMATQRRAEKEWLDGKLDTEHMENLYMIYGIRCENAFNKITQLQLQENRFLLEQGSDPSASGGPAGGQTFEKV